MGGKGWECGDCDEQQRLARNCSLDFSDEDIEYVEEDKYLRIRKINDDTKFSLTIKKFKFHLCPVGIISDETSFFINTFSLCKELNCLPQQGALLDQENRIVEAFQILSSETAKYENSELERQKNEIKSKSPKTK